MNANLSSTAVDRRAPSLSGSAVCFSLAAALLVLLLQGGASAASVTVSKGGSSVPAPAPARATENGSPAGTDFEDLGQLVDESDEDLVLPRSAAPDHVPGQDPVRFTFCPNPAPGVMSLQNAAWLGYLSANQYAHLSAFAPLLLELGFGTGGDILWVQCWHDLARLRALEAGARMPGTLDAEAIREWGVCARDWMETTYLEPGLTPPPGIPAAFEAYLVQQASPASYLQFFSGGKFSSSAREFKAGSTQVVWARHQDLPVVIVAFRGTEPSSIQDIVIDAMAWKQELSDHGWTDGWGSVHAGFMTGYRSVAEKVDPVTGQTNSAMLLSKLEEIEGGGESECTDEHPCIWVTGHSLGAALATLFTSRVLSEMERGRRYKLRGLYTFGSPRVGNAAFKRKFEEQAKRNGVTVARIRNGNDIVTRVPKLFYRHIDSLGWLTQRDGEILVDVEVDEPLLGSPGDHSMSKYFARLEAAVNAPANRAMTACPLPQ